MKKLFPLITQLIGVFAILLTTDAFALAETRQPNLVIGDDIGYSDFGCYGSEIDMSNIDSLAGATSAFASAEIACHVGQK